MIKACLLYFQPLCFGLVCLFLRQVKVEYAVFVLSRCGSSLFLCKKPDYESMVQEIFGPILAAMRCSSMPEISKLLW